MLENSKTRNKEKGNIGENLVNEYLEKQGCHIVSRNFKSHFGEIDIIFFDNDELVFSEIKARTSLEYGFPAESITSKKQQHIINTARYFLYLHRLTNYNIRFDVIEVYLYENKTPIIHQIKNVFW